MSEPLLPVSVVIDGASLERYSRGRHCYKLTCYLTAALVSAVMYFAVRDASVDSPIERGLTAAGSFATCFAVFIWFASKWEAWPITFMFCLRGATISVIISVILESWAQFYLNPSDKFLFLSTMMLAVGFSEETGKLAAVLFATSFVISNLNPTRSCSTLVRNPRLFAFLGVCVGFGFMMTENIEYFSIVDLDDSNGDEDQLRFQRIITAFIRTFLNLHPLLTGLVTARLARRLSKPGRTDFNTHAGDWLLALWLPALIHGGFDFLVSIIPLIADDQVFGNLLSLLTVVGTWLVTLRLLRAEYANLPEQFS